MDRIGKDLEELINVPWQSGTPFLAYLKAIS